MKLRALACMLLASLSLAHAATLTIDGVIKMQRAGIPESVMISKITNSGTVFRLEVSDVLRLKKAGVPDRVIEAMVATEMKAGSASPRASPSPDASPSAEDRLLDAAAAAATAPPPPSGCTAEIGAALFRERKWDLASDVLWCAIENRRVPAEELPEVTLRLADALWEMGLYVSATTFYFDAAKFGQQTRAFEPALTKLVAIHRPGDDRRLLMLLQDLDRAKLSAEMRAETAYLYGRLAFRKEEWETARAAFRSVDRAHRDHGRARYALGVSLAIADEHDGAIAAFQEARASSDVAELAQLAIARVQYGAERYPDSVVAYRKMQQPPPLELAWALFKSYRYDEALEIARTIEPSEKPPYEPEAIILRATIEYRGCRPAKALETLDGFIRVYTPYLAKTHAFNKQARERPPEQVNAFLTDFMDSPKGAAATFMPDDLMRSVADDGEIAKLGLDINRILYEQKRIREIGPWRASQVGVMVNDVLNGRKESLRKLRGRLILREFEDRAAELSLLFGEARQIRYAALRDFNEQRRPEYDEDLYWPFPGDSWKDEVGSAGSWCP